MATIISYIHIYMYDTHTLGLAITRCVHIELPSKNDVKLPIAGLVFIPLLSTLSCGSPPFEAYWSRLQAATYCYLPPCGSLAVTSRAPRLNMLVQKYTTDWAGTNLLCTVS